MRAVVFSGGGLFGAYHIGAWKVLSRHFQPDLVVGASIGSLIGYLVASGYPVETLEQDWRSGARYVPPRAQVPKAVLGGWLDPAFLHSMMREMTMELTPKVRYAVVALTVPALRPVVFQSPGITWQHLAASCAVPFIYDAQQIDGQLYADGGLLNACPVNIARDLGATEIIGINCMHGGSHRVNDRTYVIGTSKYLGGPRAALVWNRANIERWIATGERDAETALAGPLRNICIENVFCGQ